MPQLGESVTEGTVLQWLKQPGETVALDEPLVEVETEKVTVEIPSPFEGTLSAILVPEGDTVPVGAPLAEIDGAAATQAAEAESAAPAPRREEEAAPAAEPPPAPPAPRAAEPRAVPADPAAPASRDAAPAAAELGRPPGLYQKRRFSPAVARLAAEHGIDPAVIEGSGAGGRVTRKDVEAALRAAPAGAARPSAPAPAPAAGDQVVTFSPTRRRIAQRMTQSAREVPHAWLMVEVDVHGLVGLRAALRDDFRARHGVDLTYLPFAVKAVTQSLADFPILNATWSGDDLVQRASRNIGVAVDTPEGLVVPVIGEADRLTVSALAVAIDDLASRARARKLRLDDVEGGTFTVDNTGVFGTSATGPLINHPQVAILTTEAVTKRPVVVGDDAIAVRSVMNVTLTFDHRVTDGSTAAAFARAVKDRLEAVDPGTSVD